MSDLTVQDLALNLEDIRQQISEFDDEIDHVNQAVNAAKDNLDFNTLRVTKLDAAQAVANNKVNALNATVASMQSGVTAASDEISNLKLRVTGDEGIITVIQTQVTSLLSTDEVHDTQLTVLSASHAALQAKEISDVASLNSALLNLSNTMVLDEARITANKQSIDYATSLLGTAQQDVQVLQNDLMLVQSSLTSTRSQQVTDEAQIATANQMANSAKASVDTFLNSTVPALNNAIADHEQRISTNASGLANIQPQLPVINQQIATLQTKAAATVSAEKWSEYPATRGVQMNNQRMENADAYGFLKGNVSLVSKDEKYLAVRNWATNSYAPRTTIAFIPRDIGIYNAVNGGIRANVEGTYSNFAFPQGYTYLAVDTKPVRAVRMWDQLLNTASIGGDMVVTATEVPIKEADGSDVRYGVPPEEGEEDTRPILYGGLFQIPMSWHPYAKFNKIIRFTTFDSPTVAQQNGPYNRAFITKDAQVYKDTSEFRLMDDTNNMPSLSIVHDGQNNNMVLSAWGTYVTHAELPRYNDGPVLARLNGHDVDLAQKQLAIVANTAGVAANAADIVAMKAVDANTTAAIADIYRDLNSQGTGLNLTETRLSNIEAQSDPIFATYGDMVTDVNALKFDNAAGKAILTGLQSQSASNLDAISALQTRATTDEASIVSIQGQVSTLVADVSEIVLSGDAVMWSTYPSRSDIDVATHGLTNVTSVKCNTSGANIVMPDGASAYFALGLKNGGERVRIMKSTTADDFTSSIDGYLLDTYHNAPEVKVSAPGQLQVRVPNVVGGVGYQYVGAASNYAPRSYFAPAATPALVAVTTTAPSNVLCSFTINNSIHTVFGEYRFRVQVNQCNSSGVIQNAINQVNYLWEWSTDESSWNSFNANAESGHSAIVMGSTTLEFVAAESSGAPTAPSGVAPIYYRMKLGCASSASYFYQVVGNVYLMQLK